MILKSMGLLLAAVTLLTAIGCGDKAGIDASKLSDGSKQKTLPSKEQTIEKYVAELKITGSGELDPREKKRACRYLARYGADAKDALPTLENLAANDKDQRVREVSQEAIDTINAALEGGGSEKQ